MIDWLIHIDQQCLLAINGWHAPWADELFWIISRSSTWLPLYALLITLIILRWRKQKRYGIPVSVWVIVGIVVAVGLSDWITSGMIKPCVMRLRPTHDTELSPMVHLVHGYQGGLYGFVSSHAANTMACGLLFSLLYRNKIATTGLMIWVALNCYSRMYLGVHYPLDILGGLIVGSVLAVGAYVLLRRWVLPTDGDRPPHEWVCPHVEECADANQQGSA